MDIHTLEKPLVSIITPTYNHGLFITDCIKSVLGQTYGNWEMIIVDDGSTDQTWEIIQYYSEKDERIRAFKQENKGIWRLSEIYNFALEQSKGELIAILEGDDKWTTNKLSIQVPVHMAGGYTLSFSQIRSIDAAGALVGKDVYPNVKHNAFLLSDNQKSLFIRLLRGEYNPPAVTVVITRESLTKIGGFKQPHYLPFVDYPTNIYLIGKGGSQLFIQEVLGFWRRHPLQTTNLLAGSLFSGIYRFAWEFVEQEELDLGIRTDNLGQYLMSQTRLRYLGAEAIYNEAAIAFERGDISKAWNNYIEIGDSVIYNFKVFIRFTAMIIWKIFHKIENNIYQSMFHKRKLKS